MVAASSGPFAVRLPLAIALVLAVVAFLFACGSSGSIEGASSWEAAAQGGPFAVGVTSYDLVDSTRPTEENRDFAGADERPLPIDVWYPAETVSGEPEVRDAPLDRAEAPYPLIIFAHGLSGTRRQSVSYVQHLASHGYVVAGPDFPLSHLGAPGGPRLRAVLEQPEDVSFVIDRLLEFNAQDGHLLEGALDGEAIGLTGHSLGALTTMLTTFGPSRDDRIDAALPISTPACFLPASLAGDTSVPIMVVGGSDDLITQPASSYHAFTIANPPRYFVEFDGANHARFADIPITDAQILGLGLIAGTSQGDLGEDIVRVGQTFGGDLSVCPPLGQGMEEDLVTPERQREMLRAFATPFFDAYLRGSDEAKDFLEDELPGLVPDARVEFEPE